MHGHPLLPTGTASPKLSCTLPPPNLQDLVVGQQVVETKKKLHEAGCHSALVEAVFNIGRGLEKHLARLQLRPL